MTDQQGVCVLLVEDHAVTLSATARLLEASGYTVHRASSVAEARDLAACQLCDVVIADLGLGSDGSGLELMSELRDQYGLKGIAITAQSASVYTLAIAFDSGFIARLSKPLRFEDLLTTLKGAGHPPSPTHSG